MCSDHQTALAIGKVHRSPNMFSSDSKAGVVCEEGKLVKFLMKCYD